jgi:hypothetical protein
MISTKVAHCSITAKLDEGGAMQEQFQFMSTRVIVAGNLEQRFGRKA